MPVVTMPDGTNVSFPDSMPATQIRNMIALKFPDAAKQAGGVKAQEDDTPAPDDHGLARRQAMSPLEKAISPITEYPRNYEEMRTEALSQAGRGLGQLAEGWKAGTSGEPGSMAGLGTFAKGAANVGLGALGYVGSPISAAYRSVIGQPLEDVAGIPREYTEFAAQLATPGIGLTGRAPVPMASERALMSERPPPAGGPFEPPPPTPKIEAKGDQLRTMEAAQRLGVDVPRAVTTPNWLGQQAGMVASKTPIVGAPVGKAIEAVPEQLGAARTAIADQFAPARTAENVGADIAEHIGGAAKAETEAATEAARQADEAARAAWERTNQEREQAIQGYEAQSAQQTGAQIGQAPASMGDAIIDTVRANHNIAEARKNAAYRDAGAIDASVLDRANEGLAGSVARNLRSDRGGQGTVDLTAEAASASRGMMQKIQNFSAEAKARRLKLEQDAIDSAEKARKAAGDDTPLDLDAIRSEIEPTGKSVKKIEQLRQDLNFHAQTASNDADRRAARRIIGAFDEWHAGAAQNHLMEGSDPSYLPAFQRARDLNRDFRQRFGYNDRNDADTVLNKIVQPGEQIGPNDIAKAIHNKSAPDKASRLLDAVYEATGDHPNHGNVVQAVRSGIYDRLTGPIKGVEQTPQAIQKNIMQFTRAPDHQALANRVFGAQDQALMQRHAEVLAAAQRAREQTASLAKANEPVPTKVEPGLMQQISDRVLGKGEKAHEAVYNTIEKYAKSKNSRDTQKLAQLTQQLPQDLRNDLGSMFIRRLGIGAKDEFSAANFVREWDKEVSPGAKAVLLGNTGHVAALDDIATVARRFDEVQRRFGNPSGSGHVVNFAKIAGLAGAALTGTLMAPLTTLAATFGSYGVARMLAQPQTAASIARLSSRMQRLQEVPSVANATATSMAARNLRNTAAALGIHADQK